MKISPAALNAALSDNLENFIAASTPGGIEAQERAGQIRESFRETLPIEMIGCTKADFERLGFKFLRETDKIFWECEFPRGWRKQATEHAMWSNLLDDKGRIRANILFKAAFYDYHAHVNLVPRYQVAVTAPNASYLPRVIDNGTGEILHTTREIPSPNWNEREKALEAMNEKNTLIEQCQKWLVTHFPEHEEPTAYWD